MNELDFQSELVKAAKKDGHHAIKANNRFLVGVADLSIKLKTFPHVYIECKKHNTLKGIQNTGLTPHQRKFLKEYRAAGGAAGWVTFAPHKGSRDAYDIYVSSDIDAVRVDFDQSTDLIYRARGAPWPTHDIVNRLMLLLRVDTRRSYSSS